MVNWHRYPHSPGHHHSGELPHHHITPRLGRRATECVWWLGGDKSKKAGGDRQATKGDHNIEVGRLVCLIYDNLPVTCRTTEDLSVEVVPSSRNNSFGSRFGTKAKPNACERFSRMTRILATSSSVRLQIAFIRHHFGQNEFRVSDNQLRKIKDRSRPIDALRTLAVTSQP